jgi:hypothetical protein
MKPILSLALLIALTALALAQESQQKPVPDLNKSPWSGSATTKSDGLTGGSTTILKREIGEGWAVGGQMTAPYQDPKIGGSGPPGNRLESPKGNTLFGPYLEKKF